MKSRNFKLKTLGCLVILAGISNFAAAPASAATVVALGASNTYGKGVARNQAFPAQLEVILRARGINCRKSADRSGDGAAFASKQPPWFCSIVDLLSGAAS